MFSTRTRRSVTDPQSQRQEGGTLRKFPAPAAHVPHKGNDWSTSLKQQELIQKDICRDLFREKTSLCPWNYTATNRAG